PPPVLLQFRCRSEPRLASSEEREASLHPPLFEELALLALRGSRATALFDSHPERTPHEPPATPSRASHLRSASDNSTVSIVGEYISHPNTRRTRSPQLACQRRFAPRLMRARGIHALRQRGAKWVCGAGARSTRDE